MDTWESVFLARHSETRWNREHRRQGRLDSALTAAGVEQARRHAAALRGRGIDGIFVSPLGRAVTTAGIIGDRLGVAIEVVDELAEIDHGGFSGLIDAEVDARFPGQLELRADDKYRWRFPGGESYADVDIRAGRALEQISHRPARRPLLVSHEMVGRMLLRHLLGLDPADALARSHPHDVVYEIDPVARTCGVTDAG